MTGAANRGKDFGTYSCDVKLLGEFEQRRDVTWSFSKDRSTSVWIKYCKWHNGKPRDISQKTTTVIQM